MTTGITNGSFASCKNATTAPLKNARSSRQTPDVQADFADSRHHPPQHADHRLVASHPGQDQRVTPSVFHDAGRGVGVKLRGSLFGLAVVKFVAALERLSVVGLQVPVDGDIPCPTAHAFGQRVDQSVVQPPFQDKQCLGQAFVQGRHHGLIGRRFGQVSAGGTDGNAPCGGPQRDAQHDRGGAFPAVILDQLRIEQQSQRP
jgi:hypothetical protein